MASRCNRDNALALAAARAALEQCLPPEAYARTEALGLHLAQGLDVVFEANSLPWRSPHIGARAGWVIFPKLPRNTEESERSMDPVFVNTRRVFMANRGIWEAIDSAGPACSFAHTEADVNRYIEVADEFIRAVTSEN